MTEPAPPLPDAAGGLTEIDEDAAAALAAQLDPDDEIRQGPRHPYNPAGDPHACLPQAQL